MYLHRRRISGSDCRALILSLALMLAACSGGSDSSESSSSASSSSQSSKPAPSWVNSGSSAYLTPTPATLQSADYIFRTIAKSVTFTVSVQNRPADVDYLVWRYTTAAIADVLGVWTSETQARFTVTLKPGIDLAAGTYNDQLQIQLCRDIDCGDPLINSLLSVPITFKVVPVTGAGAPALTLATPSIDVTRAVLTPSGPTGFVTADLAFTMTNLLEVPFVSATYQGPIFNSASVSTALAAGSLRGNLLAPMSLGIGTHNGTVMLKVCLEVTCTHQMAGSPFQVPVTYNIVDAYSVSGPYGYSWRLIPIAAGDIAWDPNSQRIYAAETSADFRFGYLTRINPYTKDIDWRFPVGSFPRQLKISPDGLYAYLWTTDVATDLVHSNPQLKKYRLSDQALMWTVALPGMINDFTIAPDGIYLALSFATPGLSLYNAANGSFIDSYATNSGFPEAIVWSDVGSILYSYDAINDLLRKFSPTGVSFGHQSTSYVDLNGIDQLAWNGLHYKNGVLLENHGSIYDVSTSAIVSRLDIRTSANNALFKPYGIAAELDMNIGRSYFWYPNGSATMQVFDMNTRLALADIPTGSRSTFQLIRWGADGLAYLHSGNSSVDTGIGLIQGKFVAP